MSKVLIFDLDRTITENCTRDNKYKKILVNILKFANQQRYKIYIMTARPMLFTKGIKDELYGLRDTFSSEVDNDIFELIVRNFMITCLEMNDSDIDREIKDWVDFISDPEKNNKKLNIEEIFVSAKDIPYITQFISAFPYKYNDDTNYYLSPLVGRFYCYNLYWYFAAIRFFEINTGILINGEDMIGVSNTIHEYFERYSKSLVKMYQITMIMKENSNIKAEDIYFFDDNSDHLSVYNFWKQYAYPKIKDINIIGGQDTCVLNTYSQKYLVNNGIMENAISTDYDEYESNAFSDNVDNVNICKDRKYIFDDLRILK